MSVDAGFGSGNGARWLCRFSLDAFKASLMFIILSAWIPDFAAGFLDSGLSSSSTQFPSISGATRFPRTKSCISCRVAPLSSPHIKHRGAGAECSKVQALQLHPKACFFTFGGIIKSQKISFVYKNRFQQEPRAFAFASIATGSDDFMHCFKTLSDRLNFFGLYTSDTRSKPTKQ